MVRVVGFDPGQMSGIVYATSVGRDITVVSEWYELNQRETVDKVDELISRADVVVCERWVPRAGAKNFKPYSLELIGWARGRCWQQGIPLVLQGAVMKNTFHQHTLDQFPDVGRGSKGGHARDALAHAIGWATTRRIG